MDVVIWHNPRCSKSRQTLARLEDAGVTPTVRRYLDDPPTRAELEAVVAKLGGPAKGLLRAKEAGWKDLGADKDDDDAVLDAMAANPKLVERPVVLAEGQAVLGRPPENVDTLLG